MHIRQKYTAVVFVPVMLLGMNKFFSARQYYGWCLCATLLLTNTAAWASEELLWFAADGRPKQEAMQALGILLEADKEGLLPDDYQAALLRDGFNQIKTGYRPPAAALTALDARLTAEVQHYLADLHFGRVDPRKIQENFSALPTDHFNPAVYLRAAISEHRFTDAVSAAAPSLPLYARLRHALANYKALVMHPAWNAPLLIFPLKKLEPGHPYQSLGVLAQRLHALGDLASTEGLPARYEGQMVEAVKAFQERHNLLADGVIGRQTLAYLNISPAFRVRQIEVTMERLRWTPVLQNPRMITINIPEFVLRAYQVHDQVVDVQETMRVIVGKALDTRTPIFEADMQFIEFSPYWNVPSSIAIKELVPKLKRDPQHFDEQGFEFVSMGGQVINTLTEDHLQAVTRGELRIRQRPGPKNALGDIKFVFPNNDHIYLHHTPAPQLFQQDRRDFSHGCIRVEDPVALAKFVLQDEAEWDEMRIVQAMKAGQSTTLKLRTPVKVLITYSTVISKSDGRTFFYSDIYGQDKMLDNALRQRKNRDSVVQLIKH